MMQEILLIANPVIGEPALPDFPLAAEDFTQSMRISTLDKLDGMLDRYVRSRSD